MATMEVFGNGHRPNSLDTQVSKHPKSTQATAKTYLTIYIT